MLYLLMYFIMCKQEIKVNNMLILKRVFISHYLVGLNVFKGKWGRERLGGGKTEGGKGETEKRKAEEDIEEEQLI